MKVYHISPNKHRDSIRATGILRSKSGIDGAGIYVWVGELKTAMTYACDSLMDSRNEEFEDLVDLDVWCATVPDDAPTLMEWEDYIVLDFDVIPSNNIVLLGDFQDVYKRCLYPIENRICPHCKKPVIRSELPQYIWQCMDCDEDFFDIECPEVK